MPLPAPLRPLRCNNPDCTLAQGGSCARTSEFPDPLADCVDLARAADSRASAPAGLTAPWSGRALLPAEISRVLDRTPARVVAVVGPYNAGKTTLLLSFFLQLANGQRGSFPYRFASSLTLHNFRDLAERAGLWSGKPEDNIVDHTVIADELTPRSFLHLGLRPEQPSDDRHVELLLSDLPGEWFKSWGSHVDAAAQQRMAFIQRCDAFLVLADAGALMGQGGNRTDQETSLLLRRMVDATRDLTPRPALALIFSKFDRILSDVAPPTASERKRPGAWGRLEGRARRTWLALQEVERAGLPYEIFPVSAFPHHLRDGQPVGVIEPFSYIMQHTDSRKPWGPLFVPIPEGARGFATMRRWPEESHE